MNSHQPVDVSALAGLMLVGAILALVPLLWVGWRNRSASPVKRLHALTLLTLVLTFDLVLFGAFTRLTDSGLGCPDWPGCYGNATPLGAQGQIAQAQAAMPTGPVTTGKAWIEMTHRYFATGVGVLILVLTISSWVAIWSKKKGMAQISPWWATATLVWVCVQGAFGALTVTMKLFPAIVTLHLLGALLLLALLTVQVVQHSKTDHWVGNPDRASSIDSATRRLAWLAFAAIAFQIALGGWVSTNYAVLACSEFPQCQGRWWPAMNFDQGFEIWRKLGLTQAGEVISFEALTAIHYAHRMMAVVAVLVTAALAWRLNSVPATRTQSRWIAALLGLQFATGLSNVVLGWPLLAALLHTGGAAALVIVLTWVVAAQRVNVRAHASHESGSGSGVGMPGLNA
jgi:heme a synthase